MKNEAPDKIYIEIDGNRVHVYFGLQPENAVEYIRADIVQKMLEAQRHLDEGMPRDPVKPKFK